MWKFASKYTLLSKFNMGLGIFLTVKDFYESNVFSVAYSKAKITGAYLGLLLDRANLLNSNTPSSISFSLGSIVVFEALTTLYDQVSSVRFGDVCFLGSVIDQEDFYDNIHKLIGSRGIPKN